MATVSSAVGSSLLLLHCRAPHRRRGRSSPLLPSLSSASGRFPPLSLSHSRKKEKKSALMAVAEEEEAIAPAEEPVSVPVSSSDMLTMFFKAEGMMDESLISKVSKALEDVEGISDLRVQVSEGIGSVELTKQTTVQATGVASNLVEVIQGSGFKLQTLNLSFEDEEDAIN
ncbi:uncharacterized protein M6B38_299840 [Iris pallida]|uniref:HMA domain-containing protein n=1 Tax=Iris pallida TaxID=29817 RepID=A0AAX6GAB8_IRIPA|nr:uncharacterized protein M6B38_408385 [Iris pallida]KAJ6825191.1 uncharacterized protein M6B38_379000 [Iris pallida]KAJ6843039.1 uncharacterized protein M6B38_299840 [Iris pallida]